MSSSVLENLFSYGEYIVFTSLVIIALAIVASVLVRLLNWKSVSLRLLGIFAGIRQMKLLALAILLVRFTLIWYILIFGRKLNLSFIIFGIGATLTIHLLIADVGSMLMDFLYTAVSFGGAYASCLLKAYLYGIQRKVPILIMEIAVVLTIMAITIFDTLFCIRTIAMQNMKKKRKLSLQGLIQMAGLLFIGICMTLLPSYFMNRIDTKVIRQNLFQYTEQGRVDFTGLSRVTKSGTASVIENKGIITHLADTPLYYSEEQKILLPGVVSIIQPRLSLTNRIASLSCLYEKDGKYYVENEKNVIRVTDFFLFDGKNTYLFFEPVTITWGDMSLELSPFSFIEVRYNRSIYVFDRLTESYAQIMTGMNEVTTTISGGVTINLSADIISRENGQEQMLFLQPNLLEDLK